MNIGAKIKARREEMKMTIKELSTKTGLSLSSIHYIESGENSPTIRTLQKLAKALDVKVSDLLDDELETKVDCGLDPTGTE